jgi:hypothetical protein
VEHSRGRNSTVGIAWTRPLNSSQVCTERTSTFATATSSGGDSTGVLDPVLHPMRKIAESAIRIVNAHRWRGVELYIC